MKAPDFKYVRPDSLEEALVLLSDEKTESRIIAGGQSLMPMMNFRLAKPEQLIDINKIKQLQEINFDGNMVRIGSLVRFSELQGHVDLCKAVPLIPRIIPYVAHEAIRNRGTIGGSIALADPAAEFPALLLALDAEIKLNSLGSSRLVIASDFFKGLYETECKPDEIVTEISLPIANNGDRFGFYELARRHGDFAIAGAVISAFIDKSLRVAFFGISEKALRIEKIEECIQSHIFSGDPYPHEKIKSILDQLNMNSDNQSSDKMRRHLSSVALQRAIEGL